MASRALRTWRSDRAEHLDTLFAHHAAIGGGGPGRKWRTRELNWALLLQLAAEFQGYCRDLHDEAADVFITHAGPLDPRMQQIVRTLLVRNRALDRGNANPSNLGEDFGRFGVDLWPEIKRRSSRGAEWNKTMKALSDSRNAIAHADEPKMRDLEQQGFHLSHLATIRKFRRTANALTGVLDDVMAAYLADLLSVSRPW